MKLKKVKRLYFLGYFALSILAASVLYFNTYSNQKAYVAHMIDDVRIEYAAAMESYQLHVDNFYYANEDVIAEALYTVNNDPSQADSIRQFLYDRYVVYYENQKLFGWRQFHFHLPNTVSFLRFHAPNRHGDALGDLRYSIHQVNKDYRYRQGYEIGRFYDGFRFVYPLFYSGEFVGSMEWGQSFNSLTTMMTNTFGGDYYFIVDKALLQEKVTPTYLERYYRTASIHDDFSVFKKREMSEAQLQAIHESLHDEPTLVQKLADGLALCKSQVIDGAPHLLVMVPVQEISGNPAGYLVRATTDDTLQNFTEDLLIQIVLVWLVLGLLVYRLYTTTQEQRTLRSLLNMQQEMVVMTNGSDMIAANDPLLHFFGYDTFHAFKQDHTCICDLFLEEEGYLGKQIGDETWLEYIEARPETNHFVKLLNHATNREETFLVKINTLHRGMRYIVSLSDVTSIEDETRQLKAQATTDHLTGLFNRTQFDELLHLELKRFDRHHRPLTLVLFDIDHFKEVNDTHGHAVGDQLLIELSRRVEHYIRETDFLFRWGGEEFVILQPDTDMESSHEVVERIRRQIAAQPFGNGIHITCSFGLSGYESDESPEHFFKQADQALYRAKESGRNRVISQL